MLNKFIIGKVRTITECKMSLEDWDKSVDVYYNQIKEEKNMDLILINVKKIK